jgi:hypothetical protein
MEVPFCSQLMLFQSKKSYLNCTQYVFLCCSLFWSINTVYVLIFLVDWFDLFMYFLVYMKYRVQGCLLCCRVLVCLVTSRQHTVRSLSISMALYTFMSVMKHIGAKSRHWIGTVKWEQNLARNFGVHDKCLVNKYVRQCNPVFNLVVTFIKPKGWEWRLLENVVLRLIFRSKKQRK